MSRSQTDLIQDFLGSATVFASTVREIVERRLLAETVHADLTLSQFRLLKMVAMTEAQTIGDVARFLGVSNAAASKAVDKLVRRKLLRRTEAEADRREIRLALTEASRKILESYDAKRDEKLAAVFKDFSSQELERCAALRPPRGHRRSRREHRGSALQWGSITPEVHRESWRTATVSPRQT
jgi:DNA-binding MarR family transcriptional regulator